MGTPYERALALDDQPLAAYGGTDVVADEPEIDLTDASEPAAAGDTDAPALAASPPAAATLETSHSVSTLDITDEPGHSAGMPLTTALAELGMQLVTLVRTSRVAAGAALGLVILVGLVFVAGGGPKPGDASVEASPPLAPAVAATQEPGNATLVLTGKVNLTVAFEAVSGAGMPTAPLAATWTGTGRETLALEGAPDRGTRTTNEALVLRFTVTVKQKPVTFTSDAGECTIGMAMNPTNVSGSFTCRNLKSDDGKLVVEATGTYRT